jgi:hypothetical protein
MHHIIVCLTLASDWLLPLPSTGGFVAGGRPVLPFPSGGWSWGTGVAAPLPGGGWVGWGWDTIPGSSVTAPWGLPPRPSAPASPLPSLPPAPAPSPWNPWTGDTVIPYPYR